MSSWGRKLWDNDASADAVPDLIKVAPSKSLNHLLASWGLRLWFGGCTAKEFARGIERKSKDIIKLPRPVFVALSEIAQRPASFDHRPSRSAAHKAIIGVSKAGHCVEPLFALPEVKGLVADLVAERCATELDRKCGRKKQSPLSEDTFTELGVLLELTQVGVFQPAVRVERWKDGLAAMNSLTTDERPFWDEFLQGVDAAFPLLVQRA
jgi:hypothetical protein